jgi:hypothetical protein
MNRINVMTVMLLLSLLAFQSSFADWEDDGNCRKYMKAHPFPYKDMKWTARENERKLEYEKNLQKKFPKSMIPYHYLGWTYYNIGLDNPDTIEKEENFRIANQMLKKALKHAPCNNEGVLIEIDINWVNYNFEMKNFHGWQSDSRCNEYRLKEPWPFSIKAGEANVKNIRFRLSYEQDLQKRFPESYVPYYHLSYTYDNLNSERFSPTIRSQRYYASLRKICLEKAMKICKYKPDMKNMEKELKIAIKELKHLQSLGAGKNSSPLPTNP